MCVVFVCVLVGNFVFILYFGMSQTLLASHRRHLFGPFSEWCSRLSYSVFLGRIFLAHSYFYVPFLSCLHVRLFACSVLVRPMTLGWHSYSLCSFFFLCSLFLFCSICSWQWWRWWWWWVLLLLMHKDWWEWVMGLFSSLISSPGKVMTEVKEEKSFVFFGAVGGWLKTFFLSKNVRITNLSLLLGDSCCLF